MPPVHDDGSRASSRGTSRWVTVALAACVLFYLANNTIWLMRDASSPSYDKAAHARFALDYLRLFEAPTRFSLSKLLHVTRYWPPLFHISSVPFTASLGFSVQAVAAANFLFLPIAVVSIYRIGRRLFDQWVGVGAVVLTLMYPMTYAMSREVLVDFTLMAMVALSLHLILESDAGLAWEKSGRVGAAIAGAMLAKGTAVTFLIGPALLWLGLCWRRDRPRVGRAAAALTKAALLFAIVALPWYVESFDDFLKGAHIAFGSDPAQEGDPTQLAASLQWYWRATHEVLLLTPLLVPTGVGLAAVVVRRRGWAGPLFLLSSLVPALTFFLLIPNKDARFLVPLLPVVALLASAGLRAIPWKAVRVAAWTFIVAAGVYQFYAISFAWPVSIRHAYTHSPVRADWKIPDILHALAHVERPQPVYVAVLPNDPNFEPNLFLLAADSGRLPVKIDGVGHVREPIAAWGRYDAIVSKTGSISPTYASAFRLNLREDLQEWMAGENRRPEISLWRTWPLPDGSEAQVFLVQRDPAPGTGAPAR
jgi:4-amino-4-deoxy-L-arabinose transferase-like glycosyltransferase